MSSRQNDCVSSLIQNYSGFEYAEERTLEVLGVTVTSKKHWIIMSNTLILTVFLPSLIIKPQSSTGLNWGFEAVLFIRVYFYLTDVDDHCCLLFAPLKHPIKHLKL